MTNVGSSLGILAKENLKKLAEEVDKRLASFWKEELDKEFGFEKSQRELVRKVLDHAQEHNLRPAKRVRASLVYYGYLLGGKEPEEQVWKVMEGVELVQTALLMHDDFMDCDRLRRGLPTTHEYFARGDAHYGDSMAVNVGDLVLCLGYERILECGLEKVKVLRAVRELMRGIAQTALGQIYDVSLPKMGELTEEKVLAVHRTKTSLYTFQNPLVMGAILSGLDSGIVERLKKYSECAGVAFQLQDDILGMFGETEKTGKSANSDLLQGKCTLLVAKALELGNEGQKKSLLEVWGNERATEKEIGEAKRVMVESGSLDYSKVMAKKLADKAVEVAKELRKLQVKQEAADYLQGVAEYIVTREA